ncbi:DNA adenine methylase [Pleomorphomonas carboxyditropha]|uniref:Site-specific DNA-methyltransferase (adenine-specific) n=1 Tax=Pleomorphomonas carboxyditropha TaxID=2023338 RepID=A0A2G9WV29_9HYPH|nr:DNA adenine methylase [Pleomorphomonas carboxyditropha]PIO98566.1 hypothetical protein CJ014_14710 [Pleomorphomonas carboxyditropha]
MARIERPILIYFGGKYRIAPWIIGHFPPHETYVEPFGGAASVLLTKERSRCEVYNDLNGDLVNLFQVLRDPEQALALGRRLRLTPYARAEFQAAYAGTDDLIERAARTMVRSHMGLASVGVTRRTGFRSCGRDAAAWSRLPHLVDKVVDRLKGVLIECRPAIEIMERFDSSSTLHYVDPPYPLGARLSPAKIYSHEMIDEDHERLLDRLAALKGTVLLSGYAHPLYEQRLSNWKCHERETRNMAGRITVERLWIKPADGKSLCRAPSRSAF